MQVTAVDSVLTNAPTDQNDSLCASKILDHLTSIKTVECFLDFLTTFALFALTHHLLLSHLDPMAAVLSQRNMEAGTLLVSCLVVILLGLVGTYRTSGGLLRIRETAAVLRAVCLTFLALSFVALVEGAPCATYLLLVFTLLNLGLLAQKHVTQVLIERFRRRGYGLHRVLIDGAKYMCGQLFAVLSHSPQLGMSPVAIVDDGSGLGGVVFHDGGYQKESTLTSMREQFSASLIRSHRTEGVFLASRPASKEHRQSIIFESKNTGVHAIFAPDSASQEIGHVERIDLDAQIVYGVRQLPKQIGNKLVPRISDLTIGAAILLLVSPILLVISFLVKLDSTGPVLFRQQRIGKDGRPFTIFTFRSMHTESCGDGTSPTTSSDPRITRLGRFLRKTSLDELPQLFNILHGT